MMWAMPSRSMDLGDEIPKLQGGRWVVSNWTCWRMKWPSIWMCFVHSWKTRSDVWITSPLLVFMFFLVTLLISDKSKDTTCHCVVYCIHWLLFDSHLFLSSFTRLYYDNKGVIQVRVLKGSMAGTLSCEEQPSYPRTIPSEKLTELAIAYNFLVRKSWVWISRSGPE